MKTLDAKQAIKGIMAGHDVEPHFGHDRAYFVEQLVATLKAIKPTEGELIEHGFNGWNKGKITAYRTGLQHLHQVYNTVSPDLPAL